MTQLYLSRLLLNPRSSQVRREVHDPYNLHRTLMHAFPAKRDQSGVLHRLDTDSRSGLRFLLVQSRAEPDWSYLVEKAYLAPPDPFVLAGNPAIKPFNLALRTGQILRFRLVANPTSKKDGKRWPLLEEKERRHWLQTIGEGNEDKKRKSRGFKVLEMDLQQPYTQPSDIHRDDQTSHKLTLNIVQFDGYLQVTDPDKLLTAVQTGIGPAKAFGCGLLSLAPG
jgi:CRISPR system Cascade subunit CasE